MFYLLSIHSTPLRTGFVLRCNQGFIGTDGFCMFAARIPLSAYVARAYGRIVLSACVARGYGRGTPPVEPGGYIGGGPPGAGDVSFWVRFVFLGVGWIPG